MSKEANFPGSVVMNGIVVIEKTDGNFQRVSTVSAKDALIHEKVYDIVQYATGLSAELARFKSHTYLDLDALDGLLAQDYGVTRRSGHKGNVSYTSADGQYRVSRRIHTPEVMGPELMQAKALVDEIIMEKGADADPVLHTLAKEAFNVGKQGRVDTRILRKLKNMALDDPRWKMVQKAISDSITDGVSKSYLAVQKWKGGIEGGWSTISLDIADVMITSDVFDYPSLRRQVEYAASIREKVCELLDSAHGHLTLEGGQTNVAADLIAAALHLLSDQVLSTDREAA